MLPEELIIEIFRQCDDKELLLCERACSSFQRLIQLHSFYLYGHRLCSKSISTRVLSQLCLDKKAYKTFYLFTRSIDSLLERDPVKGTIERFPKCRKKSVAVIPADSRTTSRIDAQDILWTVRLDGSLSIVDLKKSDFKEVVLSEAQEQPIRFLEPQAQRYPAELKKDVIVHSESLDEWNAGSRASVLSCAGEFELDGLMPGNQAHQGIVFKTLYLVSYAWFSASAESGTLRLYDLQNTANGEKSSLLWETQASRRILFSTLSEKYIALYLETSDNANFIEIRETTNGKLVGYVSASKLEEVTYGGGLQQIAFISNHNMLVQIAGDQILVFDLLRLSVSMSSDVCSLEVVYRTCFDKCSNITPFELITVAGRPLLIFAEERNCVVWDIERSERKEYFASGSKTSGRWLFYEEIGYEELGVDFLV